MQASAEALTRMFPKSDIKEIGMEPEQVYWRIKYIYCPLMTSNALCTSRCNDCKEAIGSAIFNPFLGEKRRPRDIYGIFVMRLKDRVYQRLVKKSQGEKTLPISRTETGTILEIEDPFSELEKIYAQENI